MVLISEYMELLDLTLVEHTEFYKFTPPYTEQFQLINFYSRLKQANQMISEGKDTCSVPITWDCLLKSEKNINYIYPGQANILLKLISMDNKYIGKKIGQSASFLQQLKFYKQQSRNGLSSKNPLVYKPTS